MPVPHDKMPSGNRRQPAKRLLGSLPLLGMTFVPVHWLWNQYVALGKVTVLAGLAGQGKSQLTCMIAALTSRGWADAPAGDAMIVSGEDDPHDTIGPRLTASGADPARLHIFDARDRLEDGTILPSVLTMPDDAKGLREVVQTLKAPRLLVLDPVTAFLSGKVDAHKNSDVRRALGPLKALAEDFGIAVIIVTHLNKATGVEPLVRIADSGAFTALARGVLLMAADPDDEEGDRGKLKVLAVAKSNLADTGEHSLRFRITPTDATDDHGTTVSVTALNVLGRSPLSAHDLLTPAHERAALDEARIFLREDLKGGWRKAIDVRKVAKSELISESTLRRARELECERPRKHGPGWWWGLRGTAWSEPLEGAHARGATKDGHLGHLPGQGAQDAHVYGPPAREHLPEGVNGHDPERDHLRRRDAMLGERWEDDE